MRQTTEWIECECELLEDLAVVEAAGYITCINVLPGKLRTIH